MTFVSCVRWVKKGCAEEKPLEVKLTSDDLRSIAWDKKPNETRGFLETRQVDDSVMENDEYDFKNYDTDNDGHRPEPLSVENIVDLHTPEGSDSPDWVPTTSRSEPNDDNDDSDAEDDIIYQDDNLILVAHAAEDSSTLDVYVYNQEKEYMYVHHYYLLPSLPLCLEWLSFDPGSERPGNLVAVGGMTPEIDVWDLDIINGVEPALKLGTYTRNKKYKHRNQGHTDAVLDLAWNRNLQHIMASGSVDETVFLWDIEKRTAHTRFCEFDDTVQTLKWHPTESQILLTGSSDKTVKIFDCRLGNMSNSWKLNGEVEKVIWDPVVQYQSLVGTNTGIVYCIDCRSKEFTWELQAHDKEVSGIGFCGTDPDPRCMITSSMDGLVKRWDISCAEPTIVKTKALGVEEIHGLDISPDNPNLVAIAGTKKSNNFIVIDAKLDD